MNWKHTGQWLALGALLVLGVGWGPMVSAQLADFEDDADFIGETVAGEVVTNTATLGFNVAGNAQAPVVSDPVDFRVDRLLRVSVTGIQNEEWTPGFENAYLRYNVANLSNSTIDIFLGAVEGASPDFTAAFPADGGAPNLRFCDDTASGDCGTADPTFVDRLTDVGAGDLHVVYMYFDIPLSAVNEEEAPWHLVAAIANPTIFPTPPLDSNGDPATFSGIAGQLIVADSNNNAQPGQAATGSVSDVALTIQDVFADGTGTAQAEFNLDHTGALANTALSDAARNGQHSDVISLIISTPTMAIIKTSRVVYDPVNGGCALAGALFENWETQAACTNDPKRLPGAIIEYKIVVTNSSTSLTAATDVVVTDVNPAFTSPIRLASDTFFGTAFPNPFVQSCPDETDPVAVGGETVDGGFNAGLGTCSTTESGIVLFYVSID